jgi:hypothetical protein
VVDKFRTFTFKSGASASEITSILQTNGVADQMIEPAYSSTPIPLEQFADALSANTLSLQEALARSRFPEKSRRGVGSAPVDRMQRTFVVRFPNELSAINAETSLNESNLLERSGRVLRIKVRQSPSPSPQPLKFDQSYLNALAPLPHNQIRVHRIPVVAVVDSGVDFTHPDLSSASWINRRELPKNKIDDDNDGNIDDHRGINFACRRNQKDDTCIEPVDPTYLVDTVGHGTHVAGIIAGRGGKTWGIRGVAPRAKIMSVRVFDGDGSQGALSSWIGRGIKYAADHGVDVINCSLGSEFHSDYVDSLIHDGVLYARSLGVTVVFAAGNGALDANYSVNAKHDEVIAVSAVRVVDASSTASQPNTQPQQFSVVRSPFSEYGTPIDLAAPGEDIWSSVPCSSSKESSTGVNCNDLENHYAQYNGTSMAAPFVSGVAALVLGVNPALNPDQVRTLLRQTAQDRFGPGLDGYSGAGLVQIGSAVDRAKAAFNREISEPTVIDIVTPKLLERVQVGQSLEIRADLLGKSARSWAQINVTDMLSGKSVATKNFMQTPDSSVGLSIDTTGLDAGRYLITVQALTLDWGTVREVQEVDLVSATTIERPISYDEQLPDGRTVKINYAGHGIQPEALYTTESAFLPDEIDGTTGTTTLRSRDFYFNGNELKSNEPIILGNNSLFFGPADASLSQWKWMELLPYAIGPDSFAALRIVHVDDSRRHVSIDSIGIFDRKLGEYRPDLAAEEIRSYEYVDLNGSRQILRYPLRTIQYHQDYSFFRKPYPAPNSVYLRKGTSSAPFVEIPTQQPGACFPTHYGKITNGSLLLLESKCSYQDSAQLVLQRINLANVTFDESSIVPVEPLAIRSNLDRAMLVDATSTHALIAWPRDHQGSQVELVSLANGNAVPVPELDNLDQSFFDTHAYALITFGSFVALVGDYLYVVEAPAPQIFYGFGSDGGTPVHFMVRKRISLLDRSRHILELEAGGRVGPFFRADKTMVWVRSQSYQGGVRWKFLELN